MHQKLAVYLLRKVILPVCMLSFLVASCRFPGLLSDSSFDSDEVIAQKATIAMRMTDTKIAEDAPTVTPIPPTVTPTRAVQCAYVWTLKQDDDLSLLFSNKLPQTMRENTGLGVVWYGENCIDMENNTLVRFYPANLDITIMFEGEETKSEPWLGDQIQIVMAGIEKGLLERTDLEDFPIMLHFVYAVDGKNIYLDFDLAKYRGVNPDGVTKGENLYVLLFD